MKKLFSTILILSCLILSSCPEPIPIENEKPKIGTSVSSNNYLRIHVKDSRYQEFITMKMYDKIQLVGIEYPLVEKISNMQWESENSEIIEILDNNIGEIVAKTIGEVKITGISKNPDYKAVQKIKVIPATNYVDKISLNFPQVELKIGETLTLEPEITPIDALDIDTFILTWTTSDPDIAKVDENGKITALSRGYTTLQVNLQGYKYNRTAKLQIYVIPEMKKIVPAIQLENSHFGSAIAIDGSTAIIGDNTYSNFNTAKNNAYIFSRNTDGIWNQSAELKPVNMNWDGMFAQAVAISGDYAIVGSYSNSEDGIAMKDVAYIYHKSDEEKWNSVATISAPNTDVNDYFGYAVALEDDYAVVGAPYGGVDNSGIVYVFHRTTGDSWELLTQILPTVQIVNSHFGMSVDINEDYIVVGSPILQRSSNSGAVYIYNKLKNTWNSGTKLQLTISKELIGASVAIDGDYVVIGVPDIDSKINGSIFVFHRTNENNWSDAERISSYDFSNNSIYSVDISGDIIIAGYPKWDSYLRDDVGSAWIYQRTDINTWLRKELVLPPDIHLDLNTYFLYGFGCSVVVDGKNILIGDNSTKNISSAEGAVYSIMLE